MLGFGLSRLLPDSLRPSIVKTVTSVIERHKAGVVRRRLGRVDRSAGRAFVGNRVAVMGMLTANCGLGRGARLMIEDFRARGILAIPVDVTRALGDPVDVPYPEAVLPSVLTEYRPSDVIIHHNPPKFAGALALLSPTVLRSATIVGYWTWELERIPAKWQNSARWCDEIWVPSQFVANALAASQTSPTTRLRVVPHAVDRDPMPPLDAMRRRIARHNIGIPSGVFVAGTSWSMLSNFERKGVRSAIDTFQAAFPVQFGVNAILLLRCRDGADFATGMRFIRDAAARDPRIVILDGRMRSLKIADFYQAIDTYLSLSRSEGYGLSIAEAAQVGIPVLATGWSLATDLANRPMVTAVDYRLVPVDDPQHVYDDINGAVWAEPDIEDAALKLRSIAWAGRASPDLAIYAGRTATG
jgi:glycosyltransferase involved in cell wall biosynthesis